MKTMNEPTTGAGGRAGSAKAATRSEYPVREYIAAMARELAQMARWDGDETLAVLLEAAEARAEDAAPGPGLNLPG